ncbi:MAG: hypothetical protein CVU56_16905 [Deltaproteobacteria bacterium HGW-Deltaproteobacteria-14]|nr:MAG: hypothetical protein CVU56_16905 [Deltaproteobacteria bacterium HGW-Deltaproteobacteria-14]
MASPQRSRFAAAGRPTGPGAAPSTIIVYDLLLHRVVASIPRVGEDLYIEHAAAGIAADVFGRVCAFGRSGNGRLPSSRGRADGGGSAGKATSYFGTGGCL